MVYFGHYYLRDPWAHSLKALSNASEMIIRRALGADTKRFQLAKRAYYHFSTRPGM